MNEVIKKEGMDEFIIIEPYIKGERGPEGPQGPKGNPFRYEDFTEEQLESLRGPSGITPVKGVDYFTESDKQEIINSVAEIYSAQIGEINTALAALTTVEVHVHTTRTRTVKVSTAEICTKKETYCTECGEVVSTVNNTEHKWRTDEDGSIINCRTCGYYPDEVV